MRPASVCGRHRVIKICFQLVVINPQDCKWLNTFITLPDALRELY